MSNKTYKKIPVFIHRHLSLGEKWAVSVPDTWENYSPTTFDKMNLEDLGFHFEVSGCSPMEDYAFDKRSDAKEAAVKVIEKHLKNKAKIWFL